ncbi:MAG TPA: cellulase family glycosylhydrolase [Anaerolineae bacterium]|nr:cellulase family glycosylhydrolase [Anaerolineae bacterium]
MKHWPRPLWHCLLLLLLTACAAPSPEPEQDHTFRLAAHTLFLDEPIAKLAVEAGFDTIIQVFPWRDLNPQPDVYAWQAADDMVAVAQKNRLDLVVRLDMPPFWATRADPADLPFDLNAYLDFIEAIATRYQGRILGYIIWNEPNLAVEWGGWVAEPKQYVEVLCQAFTHIREIDPQARVIAAGLAPTNEFSYRAMDDRAFLQQMLRHDAGRCFDVLSAHDYGYGLPPDDAHDAHGGLNLARLIDLREILLEADAPHPIWITELGYTIQPGLHPHVSADDQANYLLGSFERVRAEWPWVEMFTVWNLSYTGGDEEMQGFSVINTDQTPRPAFQRIADMRRQLSPNR